MVIVPNRRVLLLRSTQHMAAVSIAAVIVTLLYFWCAHTTARHFDWSKEQGGYYDLLARGFLQGHLYLPVEPPPQLLALANPLDPSQNAPYALHDVALYGRHYYLYHGATPALLLFAPWRLITQHDLPENLGTILFCLGGFIFCTALLLELVSSLPRRLPAWLLGLMIVALGIAQSVPFLLPRAMVYEVAIAGGYFCLSAGFYFFARSLTAVRYAAYWAAASGLFLGLAVGCRPPLAVAAVVALLVLIFWQRQSRRLQKALLGREVLSFIAPVVACAIVTAAYNYLRFANPLEFGLHYQLGEARYLNLRLSLENILPGIYYLLGSVPDVESVFPFLRPAIEPPLNSSAFTLPTRYFLEPIIGAIPLSPLTLAGLATPWCAYRWRHLPLLSAVSSTIFLFTILSVLFVASTGLASQRFEVDFLPLLLVVSCALVLLVVNSLPQRWRIAAIAVIAGLLTYSVFINLCLAVQGPYDQFVQLRTTSYVRIAHWFSFSEQTRPLLNPHLAFEASFEFRSGPTPAREPLLCTGRFGSRYGLSVQPAGGSKVRLISSTAPTSTNIASVDVPLAEGANRARLDYRPADRTMIIHWNGQEVLQHHLDFLVTAPSQMLVGEDILYGGTVARFSGRSQLVEKVIRP